MIVLGIESSCDETAASICKDGKILSNVVLSQEIHQQYGGVVPEIASREHDSQISKIVNKSLYNVNLNYSDLDSVAVTYGAGLLGALLVGLNFAKGLAISLDIPYIGVNHLEGHLYSSFIAYPEMKYPYICLLVSGGHTQIWEVKSDGEYILHSNTVDDAAGEAFDKGARILGLSYPGGPEIERIASKGDREKFKFKIANVKNNSLYFSFSGLKTSLLYKYKELEDNDKLNNISDIAASYQEAILKNLFDKLEKVIEFTGINQVSIVGGVASNKRFRELAKLIENQNKIDIFFPSIELCTDNAAMIAAAGFYKLKSGLNSPLTLKANPNLALND